MEKMKKLLPVILAALLVIALIVTGWLFTERSALMNQVEALEGQLSAGQDTMIAVEGEMAQVNGQLTAAKAAVESLEQELAAAQAALAEMTAERDAVQASLAEMTAGRDAVQANLAEMTAERDAAEAELATCQAELEKVMTEKDAANAALAALGYAPIQPQNVESMPEDGAADEAAVEEDVAPAEAAEDAAAEEDVTPAEAADEAAAEEEVAPAEAADEAAAEEDAASAEDAEDAAAEATDADAAGEFFSDEPVGEPVVEIVNVTVYTADAAGVMFEAPVDWIIDDTASEEEFRLHSVDEQGNECYELSVFKSPFDGNEFHFDEYDGTLQLFGCEGVYNDVYMTDGGLQRWVCVRVEDEILFVRFNGPFESFGQLETVMQPILESMRLIP